ncbi:MAG TPA: universal stress protein [Rubrobacteraceae bacterium]|nr:universal stress protein [Rubrobacteraceae bacterium]
MSVFPTKILLATDGSEDAAQATQAATDLASRSGSELHVVHVWHDVPGPYRHGYVKRELRRQGQEILDEQVRKIEEAGGTVAQAHLRGGRTSDEVIELAEELDVDLLVVGTRGLRGMRRILMGSHSDEIVHRSRRTVLVVRRGDNGWPPSRVVAGDDFSEDARRAAWLAASLGKLFGARMLLFHVEPQLSQESGEAVGQAEGKLEDRARELEAILDERPQTRVVAGDPAEVLIDAAQEEGPTLVAVGSRGLGTLERVRLGSVSTKVIRAGLEAVLVYPHVGER